MTTYRFRNRLPRAGETRSPNALKVVAAADNAGVARIDLYDVIDSWGGYWGVSAAEFNEALTLVDPAAGELRLHINSPGGDVYEAVAILNSLRNHPAKITAVVDGLAASAASFIAAGADTLVMGENSELMIHDAWTVGIGDAAALRETADRLDQVSDNIASIYAAKADGDAKDWRAVMVGEKWYSAQEAVEAGLADRVGLSEPENAAAVPIEKDDEPDEDLFDAMLSRFKARCRAQAASASPDLSAEQIAAYSYRQRKRATA